jgi:hypothetical protein
LIFVELLFGGWFDGTYAYYKSRKIFNCPSQIYHHEYCSEASHVNRLSNIDGGAEIIIYANISGIRVSNEADQSLVTATEDYDIINIGDSFMQADEIKYEDLFSTRLEAITHKKTLQVGYPSWAPVQYVNFLTLNNIKEGAVVNVFLMMNDLTPNYELTNSIYHNLSQRNFDGSFFFPELLERTSKDIYLYEPWKEASVLWNTLRQLKSGFFDLTSDIANNSYKEVEKSYVDLETDCSELDKLSDISPRAFDYIAYTFIEDCWPQEHAEEINYVVDDLLQINRLVTEQSGFLNIFLIPPGWAIKEEAMVGKASPMLNISEESLITTTHLTRLLGMKTGLVIHNLENFLETLKEENPEQLLYFPADTHWTPFTHEKLAEWYATEDL